MRSLVENPILFWVHEQKRRLRDTDKDVDYLLADPTLRWK